MKNSFVISFLLVGGYYLYTNYIQPQYTTSQYSSSQITPSQTTDKVNVEDAHCTRDGDYVDVKGYVKNNGDLDYYYVDVKISLKNENGEVLDTYNTYAVDGAGIAPNERKSFDATLYFAEGTAGCSYSVVSYDF